MITINTFSVAGMSHSAGILHVRAAHAAVAAQRKRRAATTTDASVNRGCT